MDFKNRSKYFKIGFTIAISGMLIILFYYLIYNTSDIGDGLDALFNAVAPFIVGAVLAYIVSPIQNFFTKTLYKKFSLNAQSKAKALNKSKLLAMIICILIIIGIFVGIFSLLIPNLIDTVSNLINVLPKQVESAVAWLQDTVDKSHPAWVERMNLILNNIQENIITWAKESFLPAAGSLVTGLYSGVSGVISIVIDVVVGLIACIYFLLDKEKFIAQVKKIVAAVFKPATAAKIDNLGATTHKIFGGFVNGKIITSIMVGIILYLLMLIFDLPYAALSATIVGVTNIIPFFGPIIGAIPPAILILLYDPIQVVIFLILVFAVQGLDQYLLSPRIIGSSTGISGFWVMFSILVFGSLFGFLGMVLGVPVFAVIYTYFSQFVSKKLKSKELPEETEYYKDYSPYGIEDQDTMRKEVLQNSKERAAKKAEKTAPKKGKKKTKK